MDLMMNHHTPPRNARSIVDLINWGHLRLVAIATVWVAAVLVLPVSWSSALLATDEEAENVTLEYYRKLAENGLPDAQLVLGDLYRNGAGVPQNLVEAYAWYYLAAQQGIEEAINPMNEVLRLLPTTKWSEAKQKAEAYEKRFIPTRG